MRRLALLALLLATPAAAQTLDARQTRALTCAAMMYVGSAELRKAGRIDAGTEATVQEAALGVLAEVPGNRRQRTALLNARIREVSAGKSARQLLLDWSKVERPCRDEFLR